MDRPYVEPGLLRELHRTRGAHGARLAIFIGLYVAAGGAAFGVVSSFPHRAWIYFACVPLYLIAAASLHGISLFTHEAVHGTLCANAVWNRWLGAVCAWPVLQNFAAYRVLHLRHHDHLGLPGDPDHYDNYTRWSRLVFAMHWGRLLAGYPAYIVAIPILGFRQGRGWERFWILFEVGCVALLAAAVMGSPIPRGALIHGWVIPMVIINTLVNIRGMSQHTLLEHHSDPILGTRSILTHRVTAFFMCNENYHLEHHLYPGVPWYNLPRLHRAMREDLAARGAPYIESYWAFVREFMAASFRARDAGKADTMSEAAWLMEAARMPIGFAQVREDARVDLALLERIGGTDVRGMMIGSGGCTAAALVASGRVAELHLVDVNAAQMGLCRLKLQLLATAGVRERMEVLGHGRGGAMENGDLTWEVGIGGRLEALGLGAGALGPIERVAALGVDYAGRYEMLFAALRAEMGRMGAEWCEVLTLADAAERARRVAPGSRLGEAMDGAFDRVMELANLVTLFGEAATRNSREPLARHFAGRTRGAIGEEGAGRNPYLWQLLVGRFPEGVVYPWLTAPPPARWPRVAYRVGAMEGALRECREEFDFVHLSNVLDWLSAEEAGDTLAAAHGALRRGGYVLIRQLNSTLDLRALGRRFGWLAEESAALHARDRSFFYRALHLGRKE